MDQTPGQSDESLPNQEPLNVFTAVHGTENLESYCPPHLGIIHLLGWVTVAAVLMKFNVAMEMLGTTTNRSESETFKLAQQILTYSGSITMAATIVGGMVFYYDRFRRKSKGTLQPGHWLIAINSVMMLISLIIWAGTAIAEVFDNSNFSILRAYLTVYGFIYLGLTVIYFLAARHLAERGRWRWVLTFLIIESASRSLCFLLSFFFTDTFAMLTLNFDGQYCGYPLLVLELIAIVIDLVKRVSRDWLHWLGVVTPLAFLALSISWNILFRYFQH